MKSLTKHKLPKLALQGAHAQISLPVAGVLQEVKSAFLGLCLNAGKAVLGAMMESERSALCGPKGVPDERRTAYRGGHTRSWITLAGRKITVDVAPVSPDTDSHSTRACSRRNIRGERILSEECG